MVISVTEFKHRCLDLIRQVERTGETITIRRRGKIVAELHAASDEGAPQKPWELLRAAGARCDFEADDSILSDEDFEAAS